MRANGFRDRDRRQPSVGLSKVGRPGIEPGTFRLRAGCSARLSFRPCAIRLSRRTRVVSLERSSGVRCRHERPSRMQHFLKAPGRSARAGIVPSQLLDQLDVTVDADAAFDVGLGRIAVPALAHRLRSSPGRVRASFACRAPFRVVTWIQQSELRDRPAGFEPATTRCRRPALCPLSYGRVFSSRPWSRTRYALCVRQALSR